MPSLSELRGRLAKAQARTIVSRLSSSQCIDLLLKVCQKRNITLVPTLNGDELLTLKQLEIEVIRMIDAHGGRISISQMASALAIQQNYVDCTVECLLKEHSDQYTRLQNTLIRKDYTAWLMGILSRRLCECGLVNVCDFANEFELPFDMLKVLISQSDVIKGRMNGNMLESGEYEACKERCVMSALVATTVPISTLLLSTVTKQDVNLIKDTITSLVKKGKLTGEFKGGTYTPKVYSDHRYAEITKYYSVNGYVERSKVDNLLKSSGDLLHKLFPDAMTLDSVLINRKILEPISVLVNEAIAHQSWRDIGVMLPIELSPGDMSVILDNIKGANKNGFVVCGLYVTTAFEDSMVKFVVDNLKGRFGSDELLSISSNTTKLLNEINGVFDDASESSISECWSIASTELLPRIQSLVISVIRKTCVSEDRKTDNRSVEIEGLSQQIKDNYMKFDSTIRLVEKLSPLPVDNSHLIMKTLGKELLPVDCHMLLQLYCSKNFIDITSIGGAITANNRSSVVESIKDKEIQTLFRSYLDAIKQKDSIRGIDVSKELKAAMYISCNAKKERKKFISGQLTHHELQLAGLNSDDVMRAAYCTLMIALLRKGHYAFLVEKEWCIRGCIDSLTGLLDESVVELVKRCLDTNDVDSVAACQAQMKQSGS
ncbi:hypothetical protein BBOV_III002470 [Babesia bovis T2Bo]|uniref:hypothetical protein n=1 Tax=Babesia bovis T2Bo TaxID=484906 RepID=UPI001C34CC26|nr:hypothetical protein BBOV_III002470 [Babesia bovis T2Bo]EDO07813.2 hypothetical protein BBOV_III002470 [Babesia bovis T2Bo]